MRVAVHWIVTPAGIGDSARARFRYDSCETPFHIPCLAASEAFPARKFRYVVIPVVCIAARVKENGGWTRRDSADPLVSPRQIALTYDRVVSAHWRGETDTATAFDAWFEAHWLIRRLLSQTSEGTSVLGDSGAGIRWYARDATVLAISPDAPAAAIEWRCARLCRRSWLPGTFSSSRPRGSRTQTTCYVTQAQVRCPLRRITAHVASQVPRSSKPKQQGRPDPEPTVSEMLVAVHVLETTAAENPVRGRGRLIGEGILGRQFRDWSAGSTTPVQCP